MQLYNVEGLFVPKRKSDRAKEEIEPFAKTFWAADPEDALRQADEVLEGGRWVEGPEVSLTTEEDRMRGLGSPEFPI